MMVILCNINASNRMSLWHGRVKMVLVDVEVIGAQLDLNILLRRIYRYSKKVVSFSISHTMTSPHNGKVVILDQLS